jgi:peptide-methionine (S)-S-oxide reductase
VGYCGGTTDNPTYQSIGDYMETLQLDFDPAEVPYEELLQLFFHHHSPEYNIMVRQYASAIFYHHEEQRQQAEAALQREEAARGCRLYTQILPYEKLYIAENYHQKYYLQMVVLLKNDLKKNYPSFGEMVDSTAAARINGYVKGQGSMKQLLEEIDSFGLSDKGRKRLIEIVDSYE